MAPHTLNPKAHWNLEADYTSASFFIRKIVDRYSARIPAEYTASFYSGLGPMLVFAACRFISNQKQI